jgi:hypothetical protein
MGICKKQASMGKKIRSHPGFQQLHCNLGLPGTSINLDFPQEWVLGSTNSITERKIGL